MDQVISKATQLEILRAALLIVKLKSKYDISDYQARLDDTQEGSLGIYLGESFVGAIFLENRTTNSEPKKIKFLAETVAQKLFADEFEKALDLVVAASNGKLKKVEKAKVTEKEYQFDSYNDLIAAINAVGKTCGNIFRQIGAVLIR